MNEYIIFCKNHNFKSKNNNKTTIINEQHHTVGRKLHLLKKYC